MDILELIGGIAVIRFFTKRPGKAESVPAPGRGQLSLIGVRVTLRTPNSREGESFDLPQNGVEFPLDNPEAVRAVQRLVAQADRIEAGDAWIPASARPLSQAIVEDGWGFSMSERLMGFEAYAKAERKGLWKDDPNAREHFLAARSQFKAGKPHFADDQH